MVLHHLSQLEIAVFCCLYGCRHLSSGYSLFFFYKIYQSGVKLALELALNVQTAQKVADRQTATNQTVYPCCASVHGVTSGVTLDHTLGQCK